MKQIRYKDSRTAIAIFYGDVFKDSLTVVQALPGRKFDPDSKTWSFPLEKSSVEKLIGAGFIPDTQIQLFIEEKKAAQTCLPNISIPENLSLYPFQREGLLFTETRGGRCLIADEMGLGKTIQALGWLKLHPEHRPAVIVTPASLKLNWAREIYKWLPEEYKDTYVISGRNNKADYSEKKILIINYDILSDHEESILNMNPSTMILDEIHYIKSMQARRTKAVFSFSRKIPHIIGLSGTPIVNKPIEFFPMLNILRKDLFPSRWQFAMRYCAPKNNGFGWNFGGASNTEELHKILTETIMIRRLKKDVLKDLPDKTRQIIPIEIENRLSYNSARSNLETWLNDNDQKEYSINALTEIEKLKQIAVQGKMKAIIEWIQDVIDKGEKLVVFCTHTATIEILRNTFSDISVKIDGSTDIKMRDFAVQSFQENDAVRLFLGNIIAAGTGITLTAASKLAFVELGWTPGIHDQAEDRIHRIGQKDAANIYYLIANDTIEDDIATLLDEKRKILTAVLDGKEAPEDSLLSELIKKIKGETK